MGRRENVLIPNVSIGGDRLDRFITASTAAKTALKSEFYMNQNRKRAGSVERIRDFGQWWRSINH
jgi:hypothetical protein